jgi:hypothetical protein
VLGYEKSPDLIDSFALWLYKDMAIGDAPTVFPDYFQHLHVEMINAEQAVEYLSHGYAFNNIHCHGMRKYFCDYYATIKVHAYWLGSPSPNNDGLNNPSTRLHVIMEVMIHTGLMMMIRLPPLFLQLTPV